MEEENLWPWHVADYLDMLLIWKAAMKRNPPSRQNSEQRACWLTSNGVRDGLYLDSCTVTIDSLVDQHPRRSKIGRLERHGGMWWDPWAWAPVCGFLLLTWTPWREKDLNNLAEVLSPWPDSFLSHLWAYAMGPGWPWCQGWAPWRDQQHGLLLTEAPATAECSLCQ